MTVPAYTFKVTPVQTDSCIVNILRCQVYLVVYDLARCQPSRLQAAFTQTARLSEVILATFLPGR